MTLLDVLDLPQLYTKPSAESLLDTLTLLRSAPPSWDTEHDDKNSQPDRHPVQVNPEGVTRYLTSIVGNSLKWIDDDELKEEIWNQASMRLSERSGRTAMSALTRTFRIPSTTGSFDLVIHEPALTGDDLGLKTWAASYLLAKRLHALDLDCLKTTPHPPVLELGSGTGLVGLAMAGLGADVTLTDLPSIYPNLARNAKDNMEVIEQNKGSTRSGVLDWTQPTSLRIFPDGGDTKDSEGVLVETKFPLILAADSLYSPEHPRWLVDTINTWLSDDPSATVIVEFPLRDAYLPEVQDFRERMQGIGLQIIEEGEEQGYDDWGSTREADVDDRALVNCWYSCWGRRAEQPS